jgi:hypothetical protein
MRAESFVHCEGVGGKSVRIRVVRAAGARAFVVEEKEGNASSAREAWRCWRGRGGSRRRTGRVVVVLLSREERRGVLLRVERGRIERVEGYAPKDSATAKLLEGVRRSASLLSVDVGEPGSESLGLL